MYCVVKNRISAQLRKSYVIGAEFQQIQLKINKLKLQLNNYYCPNDVADHGRTYHNHVEHLDWYP